MSSYFQNEKPKILILEDEPLVADGLCKHIRDLIPGAQFLEILSSVKKALHWFEKSASPDLIFADIQLSDGISFDVFKQYEPACPVIFTTAFDHYAIRAFEVNSVDFLLKPIAKSELRTALEKLRKRRESFALPDFRTAIEKLTSGRIYLERLLVNHQNRLIPVGVEDISGFQKAELIYLIHRNGSRFITDFQTMEELENKLDPSFFFRANRQFLIRIDEIRHIKSTHKGLEVFLKNPQLSQVEISRERSPIFKRWILGGK
ncbi:response regulator transcription factor [Algoriphagus aestuariicola]|jgi:DNA-binding LytR/AlgR family response regulator|uniref:Response regulator transcription factor n=1 Tax=Algoriphagus aestuariicola TaxID=1852016 RepID=A0ABS3BLD7_9BACT|nr:LytTR family DNA-binding domain-containing protein [Algoriphagus aestuariicola]MBN7800111.1 response regulator transcription factor [Algoriphagus aestuariicola]